MFAFVRQVTFFKLILRVKELLFIRDKLMNNSISVYPERPVQSNARNFLRLSVVAKYNREIGYAGGKNRARGKVIPRCHRYRLSLFHIRRDHISFLFLFLSFFMRAHIYSNLTQD